MLKYSKLFQKSSSMLVNTQKYGFSFNKVCNSVDEALKDVHSGHTILVGGFGLCGIPQTLINGIKDKGINDLTIVSNDIGTDEFGLGILLKDHCQVKKCVASFIGENRYLGKLYIGGEVAVEFTPQGTLAEKCRAGGAGIPAFFTPTGAGTIVETGGIPIKYKRGTTEPEILSEPKRAEVWNGKRYILEPSIQGDIAFVKAWKADTKGNLVFNKSARNMNDDFAKAAKITIAEVEEIVEAGELDPSHIHVPGIYVSKVIRAVDREKKIAKLMFADSKNSSQTLNPEQEIRNRIAKRACKEVKNGMYINLGIGIPTLIPANLPPGVHVELESENGVLGVGNYPERGQEDADCINAGKETITVNAGGSFFSSSESFGIIRGRHLDLTVLGGMQVSQAGDLANWIVPGKLVKGMGGAMDLVGSGTKVMVCMQHTDKNGAHKILKDCSLPLTGKGVVNTIVTEMATFEVIKGELFLKEIAEGYSLEDIVKNTGCDFKIVDNLKASSASARVYA